VISGHTAAETGAELPSTGMRAKAGSTVPTLRLLAGLSSAR
jgi:hypothetical protein